MRLPARADFDYGNTRLRARRDALLGSADYERLIDADIDDLLGVLKDPVHGTDVDTGRRPGGIQGLHEAIRSRLGRSLEQMRSFYSGRARELVDLLLSRFDTHNVVTVIRAVAHRDVTTQLPGQALVPVGWLSGSLATEALQLHELAAVIDLLIRSTPSAEQSRTLRAALREYERTEDLAALERTVVANHAARVAMTLAEAWPNAVTMLRFAQREIDDRNLLIALRLRNALASGAHGAAAPGDPLLPGGSIPSAFFTKVVHAPAPGTVLATLGRAASGRWLAPLQRWAVSGDLLTLHRTLERQALTAAAALFTTGDPLAIDAPLAFSAAQLAQAANLRLLGEATVRGISGEMVRRELLWPQARP